MTLKRFLEIWTYRYRKYSNIFGSIYYWVYTYLYIKSHKILFPNKKIIGVLLAEHFGDIVACEPLSREIKKMYPQSIVFWIVRKPYRELLDFNPNIDKIIEEYSILYSMLLTHNNSFDLYYNCHLSGLRRYNYSRKTLSNKKAEQLNILTDNYFDHGNILEVFAKVAGLPVLQEAPKIYIPPNVIEKINQQNLSKNIIVLHCHSNYSPKDWQVHHWQQLVNDLIDTFEYEVIEIGLKSNLNISKKHYHNLCGKLTLLETAEVIGRAKYFIGIDSGPAHFANAVGTYGFLLFGKLGNFETYMPYSGTYQNKANATYIIKKGEPCSELSYEAVWSVISTTVQPVNAKA